MSGVPARRRAVRLAVVAAAATAGLLALAAGGTAPVAAQEPDVSAWWSAANLGDPAPVPPAPPDVADGDLLVQGSNVGTGSSPLGAAPAGAQAVAGVAFDLGPTDLVGALRLPVDGTPPPRVSVVACRATERFTSADDGPWSQVPPYDDTGCVPAVLKGSALVFGDVATLVHDQRLAVILLPGPLDRVVLKPPPASALGVRHGTGTGADAPAFGTGTAAGPGATGGAGGTQGAIAPPAAAAAPAVPAAPGGLPAAQTSSAPAAAPVVAGSPAPAAAAPANAAATGDTGLSLRDRQVLGGLVVALEVLGFALLSRSGEPAPLAPAGAAAALGGRLRPPDRGTRRGSSATAVAGVGRFRRERRGRAPTL